MLHLSARTRFAIYSLASDHFCSTKVRNFICNESTVESLKVKQHAQAEDKLALINKQPKDLSELSKPSLCYSDFLSL
jgi:hypothetical protein